MEREGMRTNDKPALTADAVVGLEADLVVAKRRLTRASRDAQDVGMESIADDILRLAEQVEHVQERIARKLARARGD